MLVVVLIIGIMAAGVALSVGVAGDDSELERERDRVLTITGYLREQAALQNRQYGMRCFTGGYEFLVYDARRGLWRAVADDPLLRTRELPAGLEMELVVEGRAIVLPKADELDPQPQIMLFSSGEVSSFSLTLQREAGDAVQIEPASAMGDIIAKPLAATGA
jgi:general secretion pathway protein H